MEPLYIIIEQFNNLFLNETIQNRSLGTQGVISCPAHSPDLAPTDLIQSVQ